MCMTCCSLISKNEVIGRLLWYKRNKAFRDMLGIVTSFCHSLFYTVVEGKDSTQ